jgi:hypothetical protein
MLLELIKVDSSNLFEINTIKLVHFPGLTSEHNHVGAFGKKIDK